MLYKLLATVPSKTFYILEWENDLAQEWDLEAWHRASAWAHREALNISLVEANLKVMMRWYLVPAKLARLYPSASPLCFCGCEHTGMMLHIW